MQDVLTLILGGGRGARLYPLTKHRSEPAVPLAGKYRLIDVPISNCLNSGLKYIYVRLFRGTDRMHRRDFVSYGSWVAIGLTCWIIAWIIADAIPVFSDLLRSGYRVYRRVIYRIHGNRELLYRRSVLATVGRATIVMNLH